MFSSYGITREKTGRMSLTGTSLKIVETDAPHRTMGRRAEAVHETVYAQLREALIAGHLEPGRSLSVRSLAAEFGVSAMPAREAIRQLAAQGGA